MTRSRWQAGPMAAALLLALALPASACVACYGQSDSPLAEGMNMGILFLLGCVGVVLGGFVTFFVYLARRSAVVAARHAAGVTPPPSSL